MIKAQQFIQKGNKKLPKTTAILNSGTALECPSLKLGLCQVGNKCYAMVPEKIYPNVTPYRERQREMIRSTKPAEFAYSLLAYNDRCRNNKIETFRYNESGDFEDQKMVSWFARVCQILVGHGITCYGYTARTDLDLGLLLKYSGLNLSNDKNESSERFPSANRFKSVKKFTGEADIECGMDCKVCSACSQSRGLQIEVVVH